MNLRDIENKLKNTIAQLEDAEKQLSDTHERIQLLKKQRVELEIRKMLKKIRIKKRNQKVVIHRLV